MKRKEFISLFGLGTAGLVFQPYIKFFERKNSFAVLCIGDAPRYAGIDNYCRKKNIECYLINTNKKNSPPDGVKQILLGKPIEDGIFIEHENIHMISSEMATSAAEEDKSYMMDFLNDLKEKNCNEVILVAGLGGATGSGVTPVIARCADILKFKIRAVVSFPRNWEFREGRRARETAFESFMRLYSITDNIYSYSINDINKSSSKVDYMFKRADELLIELLENTVKDISEKRDYNWALNCKYITAMQDTKHYLFNAKSISKEIPNLNGQLLDDFFSCIKKRNKEVSIKIHCTMKVAAQSKTISLISKYAKKHELPLSAEIFTRFSYEEIHESYREVLEEAKEYLRNYTENIGVFYFDMPTSLSWKRSTIQKIFKKNWKV